MTIIKTSCKVVLLSATLLFLSTWVTTLYQPTYVVKDRYDALIQEYQSVSTLLGYDASFFDDVVSEDDFAKKKDALEIQELFKQTLTEQATSSQYVLTEEQLQQIAIELQGIYEQQVKELDISESLYQIRWVCIIAMLLAELGILIASKKGRKSTSSPTF